MEREETISPQRRSQRLIAEEKRFALQQELEKDKRLANLVEALLSEGVKEGYFQDSISFISLVIAKDWDIAGRICGAAEEIFFPLDVCVIPKNNITTPPSILKDYLKIV